MHELSSSFFRQGPVSSVFYLRFRFRVPRLLVSFQFEFRRILQKPGLFLRKSRSSHFPRFSFPYEITANLSSDFWVAAFWCQVKSSPEIDFSSWCLFSPFGTENALRFVKGPSGVCWIAYLDMVIRFYCHLGQNTRRQLRSLSQTEGGGSKDAIRQAPVGSLANLRTFSEGYYSGMRFGF